MKIYNSLMANGWLPFSCHSNMTKGLDLLTREIGKPLYICKVNMGATKDSAYSSLKYSMEFNSSDFLKIINIAAYKGSIDYNKSSSETPDQGGYKVNQCFGHSFYVSIAEGAEKDHEGYYSLTHLMVHDPGLLPASLLKSGVPFIDYIGSVLKDCEKLYSAFSFWLPIGASGHKMCIPDYRLPPFQAQTFVSDHLAKSQLPEAAEASDVSSPKLGGYNKAGTLRE